MCTIRCRLILSHGSLPTREADGDAPAPIEPAPRVSRADRVAALVRVERGAAGKAPLAIGIGIASGEMIAGYTGTQSRATYTCVGNTVNLAARLEAHTKEARRTILVDRCTLDALPPDVRVEVLGAVPLKGIAPDVEVFAVASGQQI